MSLVPPLFWDPVNRLFFFFRSHRRGMQWDVVSGTRSGLAGGSVMSVAKNATGLYVPKHCTLSKTRYCITFGKYTF
jgi:hypothetical protein